MSILETRDKALIDEWQTEMLVKALRVGNIQIFTTGLNQEDLKDIYVEPVPSLRRPYWQAWRLRETRRSPWFPKGPM